MLSYGFYIEWNRFPCIIGECCLDSNEIYIHRPIKTRQKYHFQQLPKKSLEKLRIFFEKNTLKRDKDIHF